MRIDLVHSWRSSNSGLPGRFAASLGNGPFEVTAEEIVALAKEHDVAIMRVRNLSGPDHVVLALDDQGLNFKRMQGT